MRTSLAPIFDKALSIAACGSISISATLDALVPGSSFTFAEQQKMSRNARKADEASVRFFELSDSVNSSFGKALYGHATKVTFGFQDGAILPRGGAKCPSGEFAREA